MQVMEKAIGLDAPSSLLYFSNLHNLLMLLLVTKCHDPF